jgi:hypothetical protein
MKNKEWLCLARLSKIFTLVLLILSLGSPVATFADAPNSRDGLSWYQFYSIAIADWLAKLPQNLRDSWLSSSDSPEKVVASAIRAVKNRNSVEFNQLTGDPETGAFGYYDKADLENIRVGKYTPGTAKRLSEDVIHLVQYKFDPNIATCLKLEKFEVPLVQESTAQGKTLVKCYSDYKIYRATGKSETTMPYFQTSVQDCPDPNGAGQ